MCIWKYWNNSRRKDLSIKNKKKIINAKRGTQSTEYSFGSNNELGCARLVHKQCENLHWINGYIYAQWKKNWSKTNVIDDT